MMEFQLTTDLQTAVPAEISFNFEELKTELSERLEHYNGLVVTEDGIKDAKADRANLNKLRTAIDTRRTDIKKAYLQPYNEFEAKCKELTVLIDEPIKAIDSQLADFEERRKEQKRQKVQEAYESTIHDEYKEIIPFERILDQKWLNATTSMSSITDELVSWNKRVGADMLALDAIEPEYKLAVKQKYIERLDIASAIAHRDALKAAEEAFKAREAQKAAEAEKRAVEAVRASEEIAEPSLVRLKTEAEIAQEQAMAQKRYALRLEFDLTREQAIALRKFLDDNGIRYMKLA